MCRGFLHRKAREFGYDVKFCEKKMAYLHKFNVFPPREIPIGFSNGVQIQ
jgi:hypothetical protein